jgi:hypothetical protein
MDLSFAVENWNDGCVKMASAAHVLPVGLIEDAMRLGEFAACLGLYEYALGL